MGGLLRECMSSTNSTVNISWMKWHSWMVNHMLALAVICSLCIFNYINQKV